jgi:hypothetical protein
MKKAGHWRRQSICSELKNGLYRNRRPPTNDLCCRQTQTRLARVAKTGWRHARTLRGFGRLCVVTRAQRCGADQIGCQKCRTKRFDTRAAQSDRLSWIEFAAASCWAVKCQPQRCDAALPKNIRSSWSGFAMHAAPAAWAHAPPLTVQLVTMQATAGATHSCFEIGHEGSGRWTLPIWVTLRMVLVLPVHRSKTRF